MTRRHRLLATIATVALLAAVESVAAQVTVQFGRGGVGLSYGRSYGYGYYGNPYRGSGYNPYLGGTYRGGGRGDWYYDQYRPYRYGGHSDADHHTRRDWRRYSSPTLYGPGGPYSGYGYDRHHHHR